MTNALDKLKALARSVAAPHSARDAWITAETGLTVVRGSSPDPVSEALKADLRPSAEAHDFAALAHAFDVAFAAKTFTPRGYRTYRVAHELLMMPIDGASYDVEAMDEVLPAYEAWWRGNRTDPAASALYASALGMMGVSYRGRGVADAVSDDGWDKLAAYSHQARSVLDHAAARGRSHWLWRKADMFVTFAAASVGIDDPEHLLPVFAGVQTLDPVEFGIYDERMVQLLPRWFGSFGALDTFATSAADRTAAQFGDLLYARIYDGILTYEDIDDTYVDADRLMRGFGDWLTRFPSQPLANRAAAYAHMLGNDAVLDQLFRNHIDELHIGTWFDEKQPIEAWRDVSRGHRRAQR